MPANEGGRFDLVGAVLAVAARCLRIMLLEIRTIDVEATAGERIEVEVAGTFNVRLVD